MELCDRFIKAWSIIAENPIREGCQEVRLSKINKQSKFLFCCITSTNKDSLGFHFYLALKSLTLRQNQFLKNVSSIRGINLNLDNKVRISKLKPEHIISNDINTAYLE